MFGRKKFKYTDLPPGDRIRKLVEEYLQEFLENKGFKLLKSELTFKRKIGDFTQEIYFPKSRHNFGKTNVDFWIILSVNSRTYVKWHKKQYGFEPINDFVHSWYNKHIDEWKTEFREVHYDLAKFDNAKLMEDIKRNLENIGIPLLEKVSDWEKASDYMVQREEFAYIAKIFDFYIIANRIDKAIESLSLAENCYKKYENVPNERFEEIKLRKDYLQQRV